MCVILSMLFVRAGFALILLVLLCIFRLLKNRFSTKLEPEHPQNRPMVIEAYFMLIIVISLRQYRFHGFS